MDKVAKVSSLASLRPMVVFAGHSPIVSHFDQLILDFLFLLIFLDILVFESLDLAFDILEAMLVLQSQLNERHSLYLGIGHLVELLHLLENECVNRPLLFIKLIYIQV
jgi:hypothetical protein